MLIIIGIFIGFYLGLIIGLVFRKKEYIDKWNGN
jgi:uncharacterized membrane protein